MYSCSPNVPRRDQWKWPTCVVCLDANSCPSVEGKSSLLSPEHQREPVLAANLNTFRHTGSVTESRAEAPWSITSPKTVSPRAARSVFLRLLMDSSSCCQKLQNLHLCSSRSSGTVGQSLEERASLNTTRPWLWTTTRGLTCT